MLAAFGMAWPAGRIAVAGQILVAIVAGLAPVSTAWLLRTILDVLVSGSGRGSLLSLTILLAAAGGAAALLPNLGQYMSEQSGRAVRRVAITRLFIAIEGLRGLRRLEDPAFQDRLRVAEQAGAAGPAQIVSGSIATGQSAVTVAGFLAALVILNPVMAAIAVAAAVPAIWLERGIARRQVALISGISHGQRRMYFYQQLLSNLTAAKEIRLFRLGRFFRGRMLDELGDIQRASQSVDRRALYTNIGLAAISALVAAGGLLWTVHSAAAGHLTIGDVTIFVAALAAVTSALTTIVSSAALTYQSVLIFVAYRDVLAEEPDLPLPPQPLAVQQLRSGIEVQDVWFRYGPDEPWILRGVTCFIATGQTLALVGHNGAGKSTLIKLLCRFYDPDRGRILWDGVDLRQLDLAGLRDRISVVFQDYMTYDLTAAENIGVGDLDVAGRNDALIAAAQRAGVHDTLAALPSGYRTLLTRSYFDLHDKENPQTGVLLSGGQWQRVALARAFLRGSRDLRILDEPSSGLDAEAEHEIHAGLAADRRNCATVLVSHRLNTIREADHIIVLSDGIVTEQGHHDALMTRSGIYARLFSLQARGYAPHGEEPVAVGSSSE
jgi:ATP-binding cassette, subfamily B, bacterial